MGHTILDRMSDAAVVALCIDGEAWPRALLSATLIPDKWMGLVERTDGRRRFVPAGEDPRPERGDKLTLVRNQPITVPLNVSDTRATDDHEVSGTCELLVRWHARDDDLAALRKTLLDSGTLTLDGLAERVVSAGGEAALQQIIRQHPATKLVRENLRDELLEILREQLKRFLFSGGMTLERVATLKFSSDSFAKHEALRSETASRVELIKSREMVEQAALAATKRRLDDLGGVLEKLKSAAAGDEHMQWHDLLPALSPAERGRLLENLWRITPDRRVADAIVVVADRQCVWFDPAGAGSVSQRVELTDSLGGLRSVVFNQPRNLLMVGAASGLWILNASDGSVSGRYEVPDAQRPRTGFNAAIVVGERLFATHSQLGVWSWPLNSPEQAEVHFRPTDGSPKTIRSITATEDRQVVFAADNAVHILAGDGTDERISPPAPGVLHCLAVEGRMLYAGTSAGELVSLDIDALSEWATVHRAPAAFESIFPRRWNDMLELVIPVGSSISGIFMPGGIIARLMETPVSIRRIWASDDMLVALSDYRDRLFVMKADSPERTGRDIPVARELGRTIQDACIVFRHESTEAPKHKAETG